MNTAETTLVEKIRNLEPGYVHSTNYRYKCGGVYVRRKDGGYECETCWIVPKEPGENSILLPAHPNISYGSCYVGRRQFCQTAEEAARVFLAMKDARENRRPYPHGEKFGNVNRWECGPQ